LLHLKHGEVLVKQTAPVGVFGMLIPQVLEHVTWINLPPAQTTPGAKGCAKRVILNELCKEASSKFAVHVREGERDGRAQNLKIKPKSIGHDQIIAASMKSGQVMVDKEGQLCEDCADMWCCRRPKAGATQVPQGTIRLKPFRISGGLWPVLIVMVPQVFQQGN